jgi:hypothetical protein
VSKEGIAGGSGIDPGEHFADKAMAEFLAGGQNAMGAMLLSIFLDDEITA